MKNRMLIALLLVLILPVYANAFELPFFGNGDKKAEEQEAKPEAKGATKFIIHLKSGGAVEADNYTVQGNNVVVMMPAGAIYLDRKTVTSIEEVRGPEAETVQTIKVQPSTQQRQAPAQKPGTPKVVNPTLGPETDDEGHTEDWWQNRVMNWKKKQAQAEDRYKASESDWNKYDGQIANLGPNPPQYELTRLQDLRGSARISMDNAQADIDEAKKMIEEILPDEARKAGAPPGWAR